MSGRDKKMKRFAEKAAQEAGKRLYRQMSEFTAEQMKRLIKPRPWWVPKPVWYWMINLVLTKQHLDPSLPTKQEQPQ